MPVIIHIHSFCSNLKLYRPLVVNELIQLQWNLTLNVWLEWQYVVAMDESQFQKLLAI